MSGRGGQGEFLRQMVYALDQLPRGRVLSRRAASQRSECIDIPQRGWPKTCSRVIGRIPLLRRRRDLLMLIDDVDFDSRLAPYVLDTQLFDGVMGQCCKTLELLNKRSTPRILTALNMHIDELADVLEEERRRLHISVPSFIHPQMRKRARREIELASQIRVISAGAKQSFVERGVEPGKIEIVLPAVDLDHFRPVEQKDDIFRVLAVLTIDPRKGIYYLLQAFEKAAIPRSELVIIGATGDAWSRHMLRSFMDRIPNLRIQRADVMEDRVEDTYGQASVFVHPAIEDGFALAVGQALACGKPVIVTRQTGASQLIQDGQNGYVLECRDVEGLVERLRLLARDEGLRRRLGAASPQAVANLGYASVAARVAELYRKVMNT